MGSNTLYHNACLPGIHTLHIPTFKRITHPNTIITKLDLKNSLIDLEGCETFLSVEDGIKIWGRDGNVF